MPIATKIHAAVNPSAVVERSGLGPLYVKSVTELETPKKKSYLRHAAKTFAKPVMVKVPIYTASL